jgi:transposase
MRGAAMTKPKYYPVVLTTDERRELVAIMGTDGYNGQQRKRAGILLALDESQGGAKEQADIADVLKTSTVTIYKVSKEFSDKGLKETIARKKRATPPVAPKVDGKVEARIIQMACSKAPDGRARWTLRLLEDRVAEADDLPSLSDTTIRSLLKKRHLSLT